MIEVSDSKIPQGVVVFGSARPTPRTKLYKQTYQFIKNFLDINGLVPIITGGGPGTMDAANKAAMDMCAPSIGYPVQGLNREQINPHMHYYYMCSTFPERKEKEFKHGNMYFNFPGGAGTLDELFETITLMQCNKLPRAPIYLIDKKFWTGLIDWDKMIKIYKTITKEELRMIKIIDWNEVPLYNAK